MHKRLLLLLLFLSALLPVRMAHAQILSCTHAEILVTLNAGADINAFNLKYGTQLMGSSAFTTSYMLCADNAPNVNTLLATMQQDPQILAADLNLLNNTQDNIPKSQWVYGPDGGGNPQPYIGQWAVPKVNYGKIAQQSDGSGVMVAILDVGISLRNPDLAAQVASGWSFVDNSPDTDDRPRGTDSDGDGILDKATGHGTMIAGLVHRFAPKAVLLPVRVLDSDGQGQLWDVVEGVRYAMARGARVINLSFSSPLRSNLLDQAIADATAQGIVVVTAAGNSNTSTPQCPAANPNVICVAALNNDNSKASFSNYGSFVDVDAPGVNVISTFWDGRYAIWSGTSFSAPMVSAEAALILSARPKWSAKHVRHRILHKSDSVNDFNPNYVGMLGRHRAGLINMDNALSHLEKSDGDDNDGKDDDDKGQ